MDFDSDSEPLGKGDPGPPGPPTCDQAGRFFALLCDLGMADALDALHATTAPAPIDGTKPASLAEVSGLTAGMEEGEDAAGDLVVRIEMGEVFRQIGHHGAYARLASAIWDIPDEEADGIPVDLLTEELSSFAVACVGPFSRLTDFVRSCVYDAVL